MGKAKRKTPDCGGRWPLRDNQARVTFLALR